jgi:two-component system, chemotaxis family, chemotaxis protein CheY
MKVLLAEDSSSLRGIIRQILTGLGYSDIAEAADGQEALELLRAGSFDLLLTDWNMPNMSGLELLQQVRKMDRLQALPVVMLTTRNNKQDIISALKAGVNNYVTKPCKPSELKEKIDKAILQQAKKQPTKRPKDTISSERIIRGCRKFQPGQTGPYVLCYETMNDMKALAAGMDNGLQSYYGCIADMLTKANTVYPGLELGYNIEEETQDVTRQATADGLVGMVLVSAREDKGISLVRRIRYGSESPPPTYLICDSFMGLDTKQRQSVAEMGVEIIERHEIDAKRIRGLMEAHLIPPVQKGPEGLRYLEIRSGIGENPVVGQEVSVHMTGMLRDGAVFADTRLGAPVKFVVGDGAVLKGIDLGVSAMRQGGKVLLVLPPALAYPDGNDDLGISAGDKLIYSVELVGMADVVEEEEDPLV